MNKGAFTLIELIVGITISMILMVGVGIFVSNGMQNIFQQQKILQNTDNFGDFASNLSNTINLIQNGLIPPMSTGSGIIFKRGLYFGEGGFSYLGTQEIDGIYCDSGSEDTKTQNIYLKNFIPFEENGEDIFSDYSKILTGSITVSGDIYISNQKQHIVTKNGMVIVGKGIFGNEFEEGVDGTQIYLNSPTGLAHDGVNLYISDTLNNRILYLDSSDKIHLLLDETDGLDEPTGLYYTNNQLYISNSGKGEILKYSSQNSNKKLNINFELGEDINNLKRIDFKFYSGITNITNPNSTGDFSFTGITKSSDYLTGSINNLTYRLSDFTNLYQTIPNSVCSSDYEKFYDEAGLIIKEQISNCNTLTGTIERYKSSNYQNLITGTDIEIGTSGFVTGTDFGVFGNYYVKISLIGDTIFSDYFPLFTQSDGDLTTPNDNTLSVEKSLLKYPTGIWGANSYNEFGDGTYGNLEYIDGDNVLSTPIESLDITNNSNDILSIFLKYYKNYNCYNLDDKSERSFLWKKNLR